MLLGFLFVPLTKQLLPLSLPCAPVQSKNRYKIRIKDSITSIKLYSLKTNLAKLSGDVKPPERSFGHILQLKTSVQLGNLAQNDQIQLKCLHNFL